MCQCAWYHNTFREHLSLGNEVELCCIVYFVVSVLFKLCLDADVCILYLQECKRQFRSCQENKRREGCSGRDREKGGGESRHRHKTVTFLHSTHPVSRHCDLCTTRTFFFLFLAKSSFSVVLLLVLFALTEVLISFCAIFLFR